jgi:hypothetical protein
MDCFSGFHLYSTSIGGSGGHLGLHPEWHGSTHRRREVTKQAFLQTFVQKPLILTKDTLAIGQTRHGGKDKKGNDDNSNNAASEDFHGWLETQKSNTYVSVCQVTIASQNVLLNLKTVLKKF